MEKSTDQETIEFLRLNYEDRKKRVEELEREVAELRRSQYEPPALVRSRKELVSLYASKLTDELFGTVEGRLNPTSHESAKSHIRAAVEEQFTNAVTRIVDSISDSEAQVAELSEEVSRLANQLNGSTLTALHQALALAENAMTLDAARASISNLIQLNTPKREEYVLNRDDARQAAGLQQ